MTIKGHNDYSFGGQVIAAELRAHGAAPIQQVAVAFDGKKVLVHSATAQARKGKSR